MSMLNKVENEESVLLRSDCSLLVADVGHKTKQTMVLIVVPIATRSCEITRGSANETTQSAQTGKHARGPGGWLAT